ncbi:hypothetical protein CASFOL_042650 [Castilleja foliolosa]|uniref:Uncharacterized protein n=1 Tax=Castilleja foliolosa TaxID=1961234 RepID=A0ABD3B807_9LAMI
MAAMLSLPTLPSNLLPPKPIRSKLLHTPQNSSKSQNHPSKSPQNPLDLTIHHLKSASLPLTALTLPFFLDPEDAVAVGGQLGILEGRSFALIHPIVMSGLFSYTLYAGYLGWQWRRVRTIQEEINELKKQVQPVAVTPDGNPSAEPPKPSPLQPKIQQLTEERKELIKGSYRDKHFNAGSILLGFGVFESVFGGINTFIRTGKLFPGPHLYAGAAITILWAAAAALVPPMQKGNETARSLHIALNAVNVALFVWQIPTGIEIVFKVFEFTNWP